MCYKGFLKLPVAQLNGYSIHPPLWQLSLVLVSNRHNLRPLVRRQCCHLLLCQGQHLLQHGLHIRVCKLRPTPSRGRARPGDRPRCRLLLLWRWLHVGSRRGLLLHHGRLLLPRTWLLLHHGHLGGSWSRPRLLHWLLGLHDRRSHTRLASWGAIGLLHAQWRGLLAWREESTRGAYA